MDNYLPLNEMPKQEIKNRLSKLSNPPRKVPFALTSRLFFGITGYIGAAFTIMGMVFVFVFVISSRVIPSIFMPKFNAKANAVVTKISSTSASSNNKPIYKIHFRFEAGNGNEYNQYSYVSGVLFDNDGQPVDEGDRVTVEYVRSKPEFSKIVNARFSTFGPFILFTLLFPLTGIIMLFSSTKKGFRQYSLLKTGRISDGIITDSESTNMKINGVYVYKYFFKYKDSNGNEKTGQSKSLPRSSIGDEKTEPVIYKNIRGKDYAELVDALPKKVTIDENGNWRTRSGFVSGILIFLLQCFSWIFAIIFVISVIMQLI